MLSSLLKEHQAKQTANKETRGKFLTFYLIKPFGVSISLHVPFLNRRAEERSFGGCWKSH